MEPSKKQSDPQGPPGEGSAARAPGRGPRPAERWLHLLSLGSFAVAQPLFDVLGRDSVFFVARRSERVDLLLLVLAASLIVPLVFGPPTWLLGKLSPALGRWTFNGVVGLLVGVILLPILKRLELGELAAYLAAGAGGAAFVAVYLRARPLRFFLSVLSPAPLLFAGQFLLQPSVHKLLFEGEEVEAFVLDPGATTSLVMVVFDELPLGSLVDGDGEIDARLFPNFAELAATSTWFRNATAKHTASERAVPAILTGLELTEPLLPIQRDHPRSLFSLLQSGYRMEVLETFTALCPEAEDAPEREPFESRMRSLGDDLVVVYGHIVLPDPERFGLPSISGTWGGFRAPGGAGAPRPRRQQVRAMMDKQDRTKDKREQAFRDFIASIDAEETPTLYFLHVLYPHHPWDRLPSGKSYAYEEAKAGEIKEGWSTPAAAALAHQRYMLQLGYVDALLGELIAKLREHGVFDRSAVVLTADHGASFQPGEHLRRGSTATVHDIGLVPFFVKLPRQSEARTDDRNVEAIDVLPTVADALGIELPWPVDGQSALDDDAPPRPEKVLHRFTQGPLTYEAELPQRVPGRELRRELFGSHPSWDDVFAMGPAPHLVGRRVSELSLTAPFPGSATLEDEERFAAVDLASESYPGYLEGNVRGEGLEDLELVVAVNGVIGAVATPYARAAERADFAVVLPEDAFRAGANEVELFALLEGDRLAPIQRRGWALAAGPDGTERIESTHGEVYELDPEAVETGFSRAKLLGKSLVLVGWSFDRESRNKAQLLLLFSGDRAEPLQVSTGRNSRQVPDIPPRCGFALSIPWEELGGTREDLRVFAVGDRLATEVALEPTPAAIQEEERDG